MKQFHLPQQTLFVILPSVRTDAARKKLLLLARWAPLFDEISVRTIVLAPDARNVLMQESLFLHLPFDLLSDPKQESASLLGCLQKRKIFGKEKTVCVSSLILCSGEDFPPDLILRHVLPDSLLALFRKAQKNRMASLEKCARTLVDNPFSYC